MKGNLLDTNVTLLALAEPGRLAKKIHNAILSGANYISVVSYWEIILKNMKGNLRIGSPGTWWADTLDQLNATPLLLRAEHISEIQNLPPLHQDPFDRVLIAQAVIEKLILITADRDILRYGSQERRLAPYVSGP